MSDYRDTIKNAIENGIILDSCGYDDRQKVWGRYIDLCGMTVKDAIPLGPEDCGGGGGDKSGKTKNTVTFLMVENEQGNYTLNLSVEQASTNELKASFVMDGVTKLVTMPAGASIYDTRLTGYAPQKPYSIISDITILSESTTFDYIVKNTVKTGIFILTINSEGTQTKESVKYGTVYILPTVVEKPGYEYVWKDEAGTVITGNTITMPEKNTTITGNYVLQSYILTYNIVEFNYINGSLESSITTNNLTLPYGTNILNTLEGLTPEKEGHTLNNWKYSDGTTVPQNATMPNENITVECVYTLNTYKLTYLSDGEEFVEETYYFRQEIVPLSETPEKEGYTFNRWDAEIPQIMPSHNIIVNAIFDINSYTLTYFVDGVEKYADTYEYGASISARSAETREGYTFSGWSDIPATMPAHNIEAYGTFSINSHLVTFLVDGEYYYSAITEYGSEIVVPRTPSREGYTFGGWSEIPETMPDKDVTITGTFEINSYALTYYVDEELYCSALTEYNSVIVPEEDPSREGYTFGGWSEIPETMPAHDVNIEGSFVINSYVLSYFVDGELVESSLTEYNSVITPKENPVREGYTFSGWDNVPETMPAHDVDVNGVFTINIHLLRYLVDGNLYYSAETEYNATITPLPEPTRSGYTFSGWSNIPATMPDYDVTIEGTFTVNQYTLTFNVDGEVYTALTGDYGSTVPSFDDPEKEGYNFEGWNPRKPQIFPARDMTFNAMFEIQTYNAEYKVDGEHFSSVTYQYGATIFYPTMPSRSGYTFTWNEEYITMPANDIIINGVYTPVSEVKTIYYSAIYTSGDTTVSSVTGLNNYEYENGIETPVIFTIPANPDYTEAEEELEEEEFEQWCIDHYYSMYFASPSDTTFTFTDGLGNDLTSLVVEVGSPFNVNGAMYKGHAYRPGVCCNAVDNSLTFKLTFAKN